MDPLEILPEEMWDCVIKGLDTYEDKMSAYNTCHLWRSLLTKSRTEWMLEGIFPFVAKHLRKSDILNCRQVCKSLNRGVDSYLQTDQSLFNNTERGHCQQYSDITKRSYGLNFNMMEVLEDITLQEVLTRFQIDFSPSGVYTVKNPFISRSLELSIREINSSVEEFFEKFGVHLECLVLNIECFVGDGCSSEIQVVKFVWNLLRHIPNIKQLELQTNVNYSIIRRRKRRRTEKAQQRKVKAFYKRNAAPPLPKLRGLVLTGTMHIKMHQVLETAYGSQRTKYVRYSARDPLPSNLRNLTELAWNIYSTNCMDEMSQLKNLECPPLQQLGIYVSIPNPTEYRNNNTVGQLFFEAIERFQSSLTHLEIIWTHLEPNFPAQLNMPFVQELSLTIGACERPENLNLSFLQGFKSLRKLKCAFSKCSYTHFGEMRIKKTLIPAAETVNLHYYLQDDWIGPYESNIWRLLPSLDMIKIQVVRTSMYPFLVSIVGKTYTRLEMNKKRAVKPFIEPRVPLIPVRRLRERRIYSFKRNPL